MTPKIITLTAKKLVGKRLTMSLVNNNTQQLWKSFLPVRNTITNVVGDDKFSVQIYPENYFDAFNPNANFEKWAAVEVTAFNDVPNQMETLVIAGGLYAVFYYRGNPASGTDVFNYIFGSWLPQSGYAIDNRAHFEVLGAGYKQGSDDSEEEIWVPVRVL